MVLSSAGNLCGYNLRSEFPDISANEMPMSPKLENFLSQSFDNLYWRRLEPLSVKSWPIRIEVISDFARSHARTLKRTTFVPLDEPDDTKWEVLKRCKYINGEYASIDFHDFSMDPPLLEDGDEQQKSFSYNEIFGRTCRDLGNYLMLIGTAVSTEDTLNPYGAGLSLDKH